jgi:hypothetical protein
MGSNRRCGATADDLRPSMAKHIPLRDIHAGRSVDEILAEIRKLYFSTSAATVERDFDRAIDLLKSIPLPEERQRATVYMEGIAEMRREWKMKKARGRGARST